jgi:putative protein-disulfide isomerase
MRREIFFIGDPMCSWCWGFAPAIRAIAERYGDRAPVRVLVGGLRAGNTKPLDQRAADYIGHHWHEVEKATGQPFDHEALDRRRREGFVYDTEPPCRAVVTVRGLADGTALPYFEALQKAFYADGEDITAADVLARHAEPLGIDADAFATAFDSDAMRKETRDDFETVRRLGVSGFPTVVLREGETLAALTVGYRPLEALTPAVEKWLAGEIAL